MAKQIAEGALEAGGIRAISELAADHHLYAYQGQLEQQEQQTGSPA